MRPGLRWGPVMLPGGTKLRTKYRGERLIATVVEEAVEWQGPRFESVASAVNSMRGGTSNNAWKVLQVKRPHDVNWQAAELLR